MWQLELNVLTLLLPDRNKYNTTENSGKINTAGNIISYTTVISIAYYRRRIYPALWDYYLFPPPEISGV